MSLQFSFDRAVGGEMLRLVADVSYTAIREFQRFASAQVQCGDDTVARKVEEKINQLCIWVDKHPGKRGQVRPPPSRIISPDA